MADEQQTAADPARTVHATADAWLAHLEATLAVALGILVGAMIVRAARIMIAAQQSRS